MKNKGYRNYIRKGTIIGMTLIILLSIITTISTGPTGAQEAGKKEQDDIIFWNGTQTISKEYTILENESVILEPGTTIHLYQGFIEDKQLVVKGTLIANGTKDNPIYFIGHSSSIEGTGYRPKIEFYDDGSSKSIINHAIITNIWIDIIGSSMKILNSTLTNDSTISITSNCSPLIHGNNIRDNNIDTNSEPWYRPPYQEGEWSSRGGMAIYCTYGANAVISNNTIVHNGGYGLWIQSASPLVRNNVFSENRWCGIYIDHCYWDHECRPIIMSNIIKDHGLPEELSKPPKGYEVMPRVYPVGVQIENANPIFYNNYFTNNEVGIANYQKIMGTPKFNNDTFIDNTIGAYSYSGSPIFQDCYFENMVYDFYIELYSHVKAYNTTFDEDKLYIQEESKLETENKLFYPVAGGISLLGILAFIALGSTELGKYKLFAFFFPMYTRLKQEKVLDHFVRGQVYGLIRAKPGIHYSSIKRVLKVGNGTLAYHLSVLEKEEFIKSNTTKLRKLFYPTELPAKFRDLDQKFPKGEEITEGIKLSDLQERIVALIEQNPGISQADIVSQTDIPKQTVSYNIKNLVGSGVIQTVREANRTKCYVLAKIKKV
ncbi:right-handed parallel beta-helix repeat-containing protein [[Eubacterium] cellulosolvens]